MKPKNNPLSNAFFSGPPCSLARNTDTFQVVIYEAQFFSHFVIGRFLFLLYVRSALNKTQEKGHDCNLKLSLIVPCIEKKLFEM